MGCPGGGTWEKGDQYYIQTRHNNFFFLITIFFQEGLKKNWPEKHLNTGPVYQIVLNALWAPNNTP